MKKPCGRQDHRVAVGILCPMRCLGPSRANNDQPGGSPMRGARSRRERQLENPCIHPLYSRRCILWAKEPKIVSARICVNSKSRHQPTQDTNLFSLPVDPKDNVTVPAALWSAPSLVGTRETTGSSSPWDSSRTISVKRRHRGSSGPTLATGPIVRNDRFESNCR